MFHAPRYTQKSNKSARNLYSLRRKASPNVIMPNVANTLRSMGTGFLNRIARGIDEPPRMTEARRLSSMPYGWRFWMR